MGKIGELKNWEQEANRKYAEIACKMNKGKGLLWNIFQTNDIIDMDCDVLFVGLNPRNGKTMDDLAIREKINDEWVVKDGWKEQYANDLSHTNGLLGGQWVYQKTLAAEFDKYQQTYTTDEYNYFLHSDWKILKGLRFNDKNSFFREVVRKGSWNLINYYPFGTNDMYALNVELKHLSSDDIKIIRNLNRQLYDILNPKLIIFLGINTLKEVINNDPAVGTCHKEKGMYIGKIHDRDAVSICHTSRYYLTDEQNKYIAKRLCVEVGNLTIGKNRNKIKSQIFGNVYNALVKYLNDKYQNVKNEGNTYRINVNDIVQITFTKSGYIGVRHINFNGRNKYPNDVYINADKYWKILKEKHFDVNTNVWLGQKYFSQYGNDEESIKTKIINELTVLKEELTNI